MSETTVSSDFHENCDSNCNSCTQNHNPLLAGLSHEDRSVLDDNRNLITYKRGDIIYKKNAFPSGLYCLRSGKVMTVIGDNHGNQIISSLYNEVAFIGISDYLSQLPYQSTCIALSDVQLCMIKSKVVEDLLSSNTAFTRNLMTSLAKSNHQSNSRILALTKKNMNARLADTILELEQIFGIDGEGFIDIYLKRAEIAMLCNMTENNVIRHLTEMKNQGIIELASKKIRICKHEQLLKESKT